MARPPEEAAMTIRLTDEQHVWDCRWATLGPGRIWHVQDCEKKIAWMCERCPGAPRPVTDEECAGCLFWERDPLVH
jgi:hypothetical protein